MIKYILQKLLGFRKYLFVFAKYKIRTLINDTKENHFFQFLGLMKDGEGVVLDIGANIGIMTVHLSRKLPNSTIHAFEPMPDNISVFRKVMAKYNVSNVTFHEIALGEASGTVKMILPTKGGAKMQGLSHVKHDSITEWNEGIEIETPIEALDNLFKDDRIQGIKMDVENFEYFVLKGGKQLLEKNLPIIYTELWDNENRQKCFRFLSELGYSPFVIIDGAIVPFDLAKHQVQNFIFIAN